MGAKRTIEVPWPDGIRRLKRHGTDQVKKVDLTSWWGRTLPGLQDQPDSDLARWKRTLELRLWEIEDTTFDPQSYAIVLAEIERRQSVEAHQ